MIARDERIVIASADSDGADGPSDAAGALWTVTPWRGKGGRVDILVKLNNHYAYDAFRRH